MLQINQLEVIKDEANKQLRMSRAFNAPRETVWRAWTEAAILEQWWAPKPWKAVSQSMDFRQGGSWRYYMSGPDGERHYALQHFTKIHAFDYYIFDDAFCDESGIINTNLPVSHIRNDFHATENGCRLDIIVKFDKESDLTAMIEMGFEAGFTMALNNLDELLKSGI